MLFLKNWIFMILKTICYQLLILHCQHYFFGPTMYILRCKFSVTGTKTNCVWHENKTINHSSQPSILIGCAKFSLHKKPAKGTSKSCKITEYYVACNVLYKLL